MALNTSASIALTLLLRAIPIAIPHKGTVAHALWLNRTGPYLEWFTDLVVHRATTTSNLMRS